jgi:hypothetical protein
MAQRRVKGGGMLDRHGEDERGMGLVGRLACWAGSGKMGQMATRPMKKKKKINSNFEIDCFRFRKLIMENLVAELIGKNCQKIVGN